MRVFVVGSDPAFQLLRPAREGSWRWRGGAPAGEGWTAQDLVPAEDSEGDFIAADCLGLISGCDGMILSEHAQDALGAMLAGLGELLPVRVLGQNYAWFNCLARADVLDRANTDAEWGVVDGAWGSFRWITSTRRMSFVADRVRAAPVLFRVPEYPQGALFARDELVELAARQELTGFRFDPVWSLQEGGVEDPPILGFRGVFDGRDDREFQRRRDKARELLRRRASG